MFYLPVIFFGVTVLYGNVVISPGMTSNRESRSPSEYSATSVAGAGFGFGDGDAASVDTLCVVVGFGGAIEGRGGGGGGLAVGFTVLHMGG